MKKRRRKRYIPSFYQQMRKVVKKKEFYATSLAVKTGYLGEEVLQGF